MPSAKLTQSFVARIRPTESTTFYWDTDLAGFGLKCTAAGHRSFVAQYRTQGGRRSLARRVTLGGFPTLTADAARKAAKHLLGSVATGADPAALRTTHRKAETIAEAWPLFLEELTAKVKPRTSAEWGRLGRVEIVPKLGTNRVQDLTFSQVARLHLAMASRPYLANRTVEAISAFFAWALKHGLRPDGVNPARGIDRYREQQKERFLSLEELARLQATLTLAESRAGIPTVTKHPRKPKPGAKPKRSNAANEVSARPRIQDPIGIAVIRFVAYTGFRESEALGLRWADVNLDTGLVTLPDTKSGKSHRYIGAPARDVLRKVERYRNGEYVFPGQVPGSHRVELRRTWDSVRRHAKLEDVRLHDLRHSVAAVAASGGASLLLIGALLGHKNTRSTARYAHLVDVAQQQVAERTSGDIQAAMLGTTTSATPLKRKRKAR